MSNAIQQFTANDMLGMANAFVDSGMFGVRNVAEAYSLMLVAQAEGLHPAKAMQDYHVIQGRPALKADAMLARFQHAGGVVQWEEVTPQRVAAYFSHPQSSPKPVLVEWTDADVDAAQLRGNHMHKKYPRQMKRARVISEGVRTVYPAALSGMYTPEEVVDFAPVTKEAEIEVVRQMPESTGELPQPEAFQPSEPSRDFEPPRPVTCGFTGAGRKTPIRKQPHEMTDKELSFAVDLVQQTLDDDSQQRYHALANETMARLELEIDKRADAPTDRSETPEATGLEAALQAACEAAGVDIDEVANALELDADEFQARLSGDGFSLGERHTLETMGLDVSSLKGAA